jgi:hypothetical protein
MWNWALVITSDDPVAAFASPHCASIIGERIGFLIAT